MPFVLEQNHSSKMLLKTPEELAALASEYAAAGGWMERMRLSTSERWYERLNQGSAYDVWAISWMPGQSTGFHDHGDSAGAFVVATGTLEEHCPGTPPIAILPGEVRSFDRDYAHDVRNGSMGPAVRIHVYYPPLTEMNEFELEGDQLVPRVQPTSRARSLDDAGHKPALRLAGADRSMSIAETLAAARARLDRLSPSQAHDAVKHGAVLLDIRPEAQRAAEGSIPGALIVERNVLEWRLDPASSARLPLVTSYSLQAIVFCSKGLAAAALKDLGLWRATDVVGGFKASSEAGLPLLTAEAP